MSVLDDTAIFAAVVKEGGFSHAAKYLGLSNGLISRRIAQLEMQLGVTLIKRTTRQLYLTAEGELLWQHAQRIQQELDSALSLIQSLAKKPRGSIRVSAPLYFGRHYLMPILLKFMNNFSDIKIDLIHTSQCLDPIKENIDLIIRSVGYLDESGLKDSTLKSKLLIKQKIGLYVSQEYLIKNGEPKSVDDLMNHNVIGFANKAQLPEQEMWSYTHKGKHGDVLLKQKFKCNDLDSSLQACAAGLGIIKFPEMFFREASVNSLLKPILADYDWGYSELYAMYVSQQELPNRTRLLLEFITAHMQCLSKKLMAQ